MDDGADLAGAVRGVVGGVGGSDSRNQFSIAKMQLNHSGDSILYRSGMNAKIKRNFRVFTACDYIAAITQQIADKRFQMVRYHGWYSNKMRGQLVIEPWLDDPMPDYDCGL